jgi:acyl carrier protein
MNEFYEGLAEILEVEAEDISPEFNLKEAGWDSLAVVSTIALIDDVYGLTVHPNKLGECETVANIETLINEQRAEA